MKRSFLVFFAVLLNSFFLGCSSDSTENGTEIITKLPSDNVVVSANANANSSSIPYATELEMPALSGVNSYVAHTVEFNSKEILNFALEWNSSLKHSSWIAFYFDSDLIKNGEGVVRSDNIRDEKYGFQEDPQIPYSAGGAQLSDHTRNGADRGHLCGSADRFFDQEANNQTFYLTNMSAQLPKFNQVYWAEFEDKARKICESELSAGVSKIYVVKGGDLNHLYKNWTSTEGQNINGEIFNLSTNANGLTSTGLAVPKYYYMAFLAETSAGSSKNYKAFAFYVEHKENAGSKPSDNQMKAAVVSIDELETQTGIDFFCNLEDPIEETVEKTFDLSDWNW